MDELKLVIDALTERVAQVSLEAAVWRSRALLAGWQPTMPDPEVEVEGPGSEESDD